MPIFRQKRAKRIFLFMEIGMEYTCAVEMKGITKRFGDVVANSNVNLDLRKGEILSLLGENGSGKTTLMNMLAGIYFPDEGQIFVNGIFKESDFRSAPYFDLRIDGIRLLNEEYGN